VARLTQPRAIRCAQLCAALSFLHDRETPLVHRDIKAANLFCTADRKTLKLGDFGLCRPVKTLEHGDDARDMTGMTGIYIPHPKP
jgi:serine/threonine protein kinase